ncbi:MULTISPECIES: hypothetical protein [Xenorhabdus]|uniref:hypothetical protein n=1 Tax=Xenorhabdus TaxID=626 RepID=UPI00064B6701|nr:MULTISPECIES: hypothetical protein [Xenorhabdus]KLU16123.1 hypothetical protein AAY47_07240 [Xenorhabdus griffiniae]KOP31799.1 hypothetical protein AFK69_18950 [Xenorhabdus sp. GDc328]
MKYDPRLRTWVEDDFDYASNYKKITDDINYRELEKQLNENIDYYALLDQNEAMIYLNELGSGIKDNIKYGVDIINKDIFPTTDFFSNFAGNIKDTPALLKTIWHFKPTNIGMMAFIINELKGKGIKATEYLGKDGVRYIKLSGYPAIRRYLNATRYIITNKKIMDVGIGTAAMEGSIVKGMRFGIIFSAGYRAAELMLKDEYDLTNFAVNFSMDVAKIVVSTAVAKFAVGALVTSPIFAIGASAAVVAIGVFAIGLGIAALLYFVDDQFKISESIIKRLKEGYKEKSPTPYHPDQLFNLWGRYSRG